MAESTAGPADGIVGSDGNPWHCSMDAVAWAKAFVALHPHAEVTVLCDTEEAMLGWFANAIMTGFDEGQRRLTDEQRQRTTFDLDPWKQAR